MRAAVIAALIAEATASGRNPVSATMPGKLLSRTVAKDTVLGIIIGAVLTGLVGSLFTDPLKRAGEWMSDAVYGIFQNRELVVNFPQGSDFDAGSFKVTIFEAGGDPANSPAMPLSDYRSSRFFESEFADNLLRDEVEILVSYTWRYVTYVNISKPINLSDRRFEYSPPEIGLGNYHPVPVNTSPPPDSAAPVQNFRNSQAEWLDVGVGEIGVSENSQAGRQKILLYLESAGIISGDSSTPWGCAFLSWTFKEVNIEPPPRAARCSSWRQFGTELEAPLDGAIANVLPILPESVSGIAGIVTDFDDDTVTILMGNYHNGVGLAVLPRDRVLSYRWPDG